MYKLLLLLVATQAIAVHSWCHHSRCSRIHHDYKNGSHTHDGDFHRLSWDVIRIDRQAKMVCNEDSPHTTDTFLANHYEISVPLEGFAEEEISVKLKHRVLFIQAVKSTENVFSELKILPDFANGKAASWKFEGNGSVLTINVPYDIALRTEVAKSCNKPIDESVITIPKAGIDVRFGADDETTVTPLEDENLA